MRAIHYKEVLYIRVHLAAINYHHSLVRNLQHIAFPLLHIAQ